MPRLRVRALRLEQRLLLLQHLNDRARTDLETRLGRFQRLCAEITACLVASTSLMPAITAR